MRRTVYLLPLLAASLHACSRSGHEARARAGAPRNVILISLDTLRADYLGSYGYSLPTSPRFDAFAKRAVRFENCWSGSGHTLSSHKAILSGLHTSSFLKAYSDAGGPRDPVDLPLDYYKKAFLRFPVPPLPQRLKDSGRKTGAFADGGYMRPHYGWKQGFDAFRSSKRIGLETIRRHAQEWIVEAGESPFFLFVHSYDVHCPYSPPEGFLKAFEPACDGRLQFEKKCGKGHFNDLDLTQQDKLHIRRHYCGNIRHADSELGNLLDQLESAGRFQDSIIVVTSDHGESLGERDFVGHGQLYENQLRVPLVIWAPGLQPGVVRERTMGVDIAATVLDLLLGEVPADLDGWSLRALLPGAPPAPDGAQRHGHAAFAARPRVAAITINEGREGLTFLRKLAIGAPSGLKLILEMESGRGELYDLRRDPGEAKNLFGQGLAEQAQLITLAHGFDPGPLRNWTGKGGAKGGGVDGLSPEERDELRSLGYVN